MPAIFILIWVQAVDKVKANISCSWNKIWRRFEFTNNSTPFNLRIGVFSQFVIFKFNVDPRFAVSNTYNPKIYRDTNTNLECCRLIGYKLVRSVVHKYFQHGKG